MKKNLQHLFEELIEDQKKKLLAKGREFVPNLTPEDMLQPNDFEELEDNGLFRYEEGILDGLQVAKAAYLAYQKDQVL